MTGGTGFIGSNVVKALAERGHEVVSLDIAAPDDLVRRYLEPWTAQVTWVEGDILDKVALEQFAATYKIRKMVHAAVYTPNLEDVERANTRGIIDINIGGTANLLDLARRVSVERFLYVSSSAVYRGAHSTDKPLKEDIPLNPQNLYGITKYASELLTKKYGELHGFDAVSVRLAGPYGPIERVTGHRTVMSLVYECTGKAVRSEPIEVVPRGSMNWTYVLDTAAAICTVLDAPALPHGVYNISRGRRVSVDGLIAALREAYPDAKFVEPISPELPTPASGGYRQPPLDQTRLRDDLGFVAQFDLVSGLRAYLNWRQAYHFMD